MFLSIAFDSIFIKAEDEMTAINKKEEEESRFQSSETDLRACRRPHYFALGIAMKGFAILLVFASLNALGAEWALVSEVNGIEVYVDATSIARSGEFKEAGLTYSYASPQLINGKIFKSSKSLKLFSCHERISGFYKITYYAEPFGAGAIVQAWEMPSKEEVIFLKVGSDTVGERIFNFVCRVAGPRT